MFQTLYGYVATLVAQKLDITPGLEFFVAREEADKAQADWACIDRKVVAMALTIPSTVFLLSSFHRHHYVHPSHLQGVDNDACFELDIVHAEATSLLQHLLQFLEHLPQSRS